MTTDSAKRILLIDIEDARRNSRVMLLESAGYSVTINNSHRIAESLEQEYRFDLIVLALHAGPEEAASYSDRLTQRVPHLPILLLTDSGVFAPAGTLSRSMEAGNSRQMLQNVAVMLAGSSYIREI